VGDYTAGAIASIAFQQAVPAVDGNVLRVLTRITGDEGDITRPDTKKRIRALIAETMPRNLPGAYNQSLMELGALVCLPNGAPDCEHCPVQELCIARKEGRTGELPVKSSKSPRKAESRRVYLVFSGCRVALRRRPERGLLARLWEFPNELEPSSPGWAPQLKLLEEGPKGKHIFTHREWHMSSGIYALNGPLPEDWVWANESELETVYAVPGALDAFKKTVLEHLRGETS
jgi:A/G-specific adenine glycosylase